MRVLTIKEPFASLVAYRIKRIETRSWKTKYRGEIYIHAGLAKVNVKDKRISHLLSYLPNPTPKYGEIIAKANLVDCVFMDDVFLKQIKENPVEYECGHYEYGRYAWVLEDVELLENPISAKGKLGIWYYENSNRN